MKKLLFIFIILQAILVYSNAFAGDVYVIRIDGAISPPISDYLKRGIQTAINKKASALVVELNTPGGLLKTTREIVQDILESPVPIIVYVTPKGAHAGSAGVFITMAGHIAAMSPGTNIGAAHPVSMQQSMDSIMSTKVTNDAAAFIRSIAEQRQRDTIWAELAVRKSESITAAEAKERNVIDIVANDIEELLKALQDKEVKIGNELKSLNLSTSAIIELPMNFFEKMLVLIADPEVAYVFMTLGLLGIILELYSPGTLFPGIVGSISLLLSFYAMHSLPVNIIGLALVILAVIFFIAEVYTTTNGVLTVGGIIALFLGSMMLLKTNSPLEFAQISNSVIIPTVLLVAAFFGGIAWFGLRAQNEKVSTGEDALIGAEGEVTEDFSDQGWVMVQGELWQASSNGVSFKKGDKVVVKNREHFKLIVSKTK